MSLENFEAISEMKIYLLKLLYPKHVYGLCCYDFYLIILSVVASEFRCISSLDCWQRLKVMRFIRDSNLPIIVQMRTFLCVLHWDYSLV